GRTAQPLALTWNAGVHRGRFTRDNTRKRGVSQDAVREDQSRGLFEEGLLPFCYPFHPTRHPRARKEKPACFPPAWFTATPPPNDSATCPVRLSEAGGKGRPAAYSCLGVLPGGGVDCLHERGRKADCPLRVGPRACYVLRP